MTRQHKITIAKERYKAFCANCKDEIMRNNKFLQIAEELELNGHQIYSLQEYAASLRLIEYSTVDTKDLLAKNLRQGIFLYSDKTKLRYVLSEVLYMHTSLGDIPRNSVFCLVCIDNPADTVVEPNLYAITKEVNNRGLNITNKKILE